MYNVHNIKSLYTFEIYISYFKCKPTSTAIMTDTADNWYFSTCTAGKYLVLLNMMGLKCLEEDQSIHVHV